MNIIPLRPSDKDYKSIKDTDKDILSYAVLWGVPHEDVFAKFNPEYVISNGALSTEGKAKCKKFFGYKKHSEYMEAYRETLNEFIGGQADGGSRTEKATSKLVSDCLAAIENNKALEPEVLRDFVDMARKLGILKDAEEKGVEPPRRYLPARCYSECQYRFFVETAVLNKDAIVDCDYCRTRKFAEDNGWKFDPTKNLDLPEEIIKLTSPEK